MKLPQGMPPRTVLASLTADGEFEITDTVAQLQKRVETRSVKIDGKVVPQQVEFVVTVAVPVTRRYKGEGMKVFTAGGKEVDAKDLPEKLKKPTAVLLSADGAKIDPFYLTIIKEDTLVLIPPAPMLTPAPMPMPAPPPPPEK